MLVATALKNATSSMLGKLAYPSSPAAADMGDDAHSSASSVEANNSFTASALASRWAPAPCCHACGATRAPVACTECSHHYCTSCATGGAMSSGSGSGGADTGSPIASSTAGLAACPDCSSVCYACRPLTCGMCPKLPPAKMCEACFDECDQCGRPACPACAAQFARCERCQYSQCPDCAWEEVVAQPRSPAAAAAAAAAAGALGSPKALSARGEVEAAGAGGAAVGGCWCDGGTGRIAPGPSSADRARKVVQRYHMSATTHPRLLGRNMAAAGLRDAEDEDAYDEEELEGGDWEEEEEGGRVGSGVGEDWGPSSLSLSSSWGPRSLLAAVGNSSAGCGGAGSSVLLRAGSLESGGLVGGRHRPWLL